MLDGSEIDASIVENYSGRCMYGTETFGVKTDASPGKTLAAVLVGILGIPSFETDDYPDVEYSDFQNLQSDTLGLGYVIY
ncbi:hypothetical protein Lepto7375DRAFT_7247 [Leptolyngbya sp. PCC 7375]|nr:hypothetical protein Lepto7375DRAFT_7247 [Leptolyngbya sp. PCC 7375]